MKYGFNVSYNFVLIAFSLVWWLCYLWLRFNPKLNSIQHAATHIVAIPQRQRLTQWHHNSGMGKILQLEWKGVIFFLAFSWCIQLSMAFYRCLLCSVVGMLMWLCIVLFECKYGDIETLLLSKKKGGTAVIEFKRRENAVSLNFLCDNVPWQVNK